MPTFFDKMLSFSTFPQLVEEQHYQRVPDDWWVVVSDVTNSTDAIEQGRYRDVNTVGAATIAAIQTALADQTFPFVFGGDGATGLIPGDARTAVEAELHAVREIARRQFGLRLRVGMVAVSELAERGRPVLLAKFALNARSPLALFRGGGISLAEELIKGTADYEIPPHETTDTDLSKLSCRWQPLVAQNGEMLALMVQAHGTERDAIYRAVLDDLAQELGDLEAANPVKTATMKQRPLLQVLRDDGKYQNNPLRRIRRMVHTLVSSFLFGTGLYRLVAPMKRYRAATPQHSDYRKFDDMLRMVVDCSPEQSSRIEAGLAERHELGEVSYGLHRSQEALMTCYLHSFEDGEHIHFVDGGDGGYAMASKQFKAQLKARREPDGR